MYMVPLCSSGSIVFSRFHCVLQVSLCSLGFIVFSWFNCILSVPLCYTGSIVFSWFHCILLVPLYSPVYCFLMEKLQSQENDSIFHIFYQIKDIQNRALPIAMFACRGSFKVTTYLVPSRKDSSRQSTIHGNRKIDQLRTTSYVSNEKRKTTCPLISWYYFHDLVEINVVFVGIRKK